MPKVITDLRTCQEIGLPAAESRHKYAGIPRRDKRIANLSAGLRVGQALAIHTARIFQL
jgi:hypothetical protein